MLGMDDLLQVGISESLRATYMKKRRPPWPPGTSRTQEDAHGQPHASVRPPDGPHPELDRLQWSGAGLDRAPAANARSRLVHGLSHGAWGEPEHDHHAGLPHAGGCEAGCQLEPPEDHPSGDALNGDGSSQNAGRRALALHTRATSTLSSGEPPARVTEA